MTREAIEMATGDFQNSHLVVDPTEEALHELDRRLLTIAGKMYLAQLTAACHLVRLWIIFAAKLGHKSAMDLKLIVEELSPEELAVFVAVRVMTFATPFIRDQNDADDLAEAKKELDPRGCVTGGTYHITLKTDSVFGKNFPGGKFVKYEGESNNVGGRTYQHDRAFEGVEGGEKAVGGAAKVRVETSALEALYRERLGRRRHFIDTSGPKGVTDKRTAAEWYERMLAGSQPRTQLKLRDMGSRRCKNRDDRWEYMCRQVRGLDEHVMAALYGTVKDKGYPDAKLYAGVRFDVDFEGANVHVPRLGFGDIPGSLASRHAARYVTKAEKQLAYDEAMLVREGGSIAESLFSQPGRVGPSKRLQMRPRGYKGGPIVYHPPPPSTTTAASSSRFGGDEGSETQEGDYEGVDEDEDEEIILDGSRLEGPLNVTQANVVDKVRYRSTILSQQGESVAWRLDEAARTVERDADMSDEEATDVWNRMRTVGIAGIVSNGAWRAEVAPSLDPVEVQLPWDFKSGPANLFFKTIRASKKAFQPRTATPEASYILNTYEVLLRHEDDASEVKRFAPWGQDVSPQLCALLSPFAVVAAMHREEDLVYAVGEGALVGAGVRVRDGWCRCPLKPSPKGPEWSVVDLPGSAWDWAAFGTFLAEDAGVDEKTIERTVGEINVPPQDAKGRPQDVLFHVNKASNGKYGKVYYVLRPQEGDEVVRKGDQKELTADMCDIWIKSFLINCALLSRGCKNTQLHHPPPQAAAASPTASPKKRSKKDLPPEAGPSGSKKSKPGS